MSSEQTTGRTRHQWEALARARIRKGERAEEVAAEFVRDGLEPSLAGQIVEDAIRAARKRAAGPLIFGIALVAYGLMCSILSFSAETANPGAWATALLGGVVALVGLARLARIRR